MLLAVGLLLLGLVLLIKGADWLVNGASALAKSYQVSDLAVGLTVVAFGTSAPELVVNSIASIQDHQELVFANVIGSNNFNLFLILGLAGVITPLAVQSSTVWKEIPLSLLAVILLYLMVNSSIAGEKLLLSRPEAVILLLIFLGFLYYVFRQMKQNNIAGEVQPIATKRAKLWLKVILGLAGLVIGGQLLVMNAIEIASSLGVSEKLVGLTIVAMGTSLPEMATSLVAALRKNADIAVGNIIGSNLFNIFFILAISALIQPIEYDPLFDLELYLLAGGTLLLFLAMLSGQKHKLDRWEAALLLAGFAGYMVYLISSALQ